jgi:hypothetical protein
VFDQVGRYLLLDLRIHPFCCSKTRGFKASEDKKNKKVSHERQMTVFHTLHTLSKDPISPQPMPQKKPFAQQPSPALVTSLLARLLCTSRSYGQGPVEEPKSSLEALQIADEALTALSRRQKLMSLIIGRVWSRFR